MDAIFGIKDHLTIGQECARAVLIFVYGLVMLRLSGKRTFARWSALDIVISIVVGSNLSRALTGSAPLAGTLAAVAVLVLLHFVCSYAAAHSAWFSRLLEGTSAILGEHGQADERRRKRHLISDEDLIEALRDKGVETLGDTRKVVLEANGKITVIKRVDPVRAMGEIAENLREIAGAPVRPQS